MGRQIAVDMGLRPYRVWAVLVRWSGGERGRGSADVEREVELTPTPQISFRMRRQPGPAGFTERVEARLEGVSARYTEEELEQLFPRDLDAAHEAFLEARMDSGKRRRFVVATVPQLDLESSFGWSVDLRSQDDARTLAGELGERVRRR